MRWSRAAMIGGILVGVALACNKGKEGNAVMMDSVSTSPTAGAAFGSGYIGDASSKAASAPARERDLSRNESMAMQAEVTTRGPQSAEPSMPPQSSLPIDATAPMIVRTGNATIQVDALEPAVARIRLLAQSLGGYVGNTSMQTGSNQMRSASIEIKIPARRWSDLLTGLNPIGKREAVTESAQDVGEEFVDVTARVVNARRLEERLISLLANRTGKLSDALSVERELARVREEIERYEGRIRYLRAQATMSTMLVNLHEPPPVLGSQPGSNPIADAFRAAWSNFVGFIAGVIAMLGVLVPLALLGVFVWWLIRRYRPAPPSKS